MKQSHLLRTTISRALLALCFLSTTSGKSFNEWTMGDYYSFSSKKVIEEDFTDDTTVKTEGNNEVADKANDTLSASVATDIPYCKFRITVESVKYWQSRIETEEPDFVQFTLRLNHSYTVAAHVLKPMEWVWTFNTPFGRSPFLHWPLDYGTLSFGLLSAKTLSIKYIDIYSTCDGECKIHIGGNETTRNLAEAFVALVNNTRKPYLNRFCSYVYTSADRSSFSYISALYLRYPFSNAQKMYSCCNIKHMYSRDDYRKQCFKIAKRWDSIVAAPYVLGILFFVCSPILMFTIAASFSKGHSLESVNYVLIPQQATIAQVHLRVNKIDDWVFLDGEPPLSFLDMFSFIPDCLKRRYPVFMSRMARLLILVALPMTMLPQICMYNHGIDKHGQTTIEDLLKIGIPSTFNALLSSDLGLMTRQFVPIFGGPIGLLVIYTVLGVVFIVAPENFELTMENGMPRTRSCSVLFLDFSDVCKLAGIHSHKQICGFKKVATMLKASIYMFFGRHFWTLTFNTFCRRFAKVSNLSLGFKLLLYPLLFLACLIEWIAILLYYALPICGCLSITMKGIALAIYQTNFRHNTLNRLFHCKWCRVIIASLVLFLWSIFVFAVAHVLMQNFMFVAQLILFCFIAIFTYPSVAFGYVFFFVTLVFYLVQLVRKVGEDYTDVLNIAVDISRDMDNDLSSVSVCDRNLYIKDVRFGAVDGIYINDVKLKVHQSILQTASKYEPIRKTMRQYHAFGIPRELFTILVNKHLPTQVQLFKVLVKIAFVIVFVVCAERLTSVSTNGPTSEMSDVMHVIFIIGLGAVPRVIEVVFVGETESIKQEVRVRCIEETIREYWHDKEQAIIY